METQMKQEELEREDIRLPSQYSGNGITKEQVQYSIQIANDLVTVPVQTIFEIAYMIIGPTIHSRIKRERQSLPI
jgi:hypothetical protein